MAAAHCGKGFHPFLKTDHHQRMIEMNLGGRRTSLHLLRPRLTKQQQQQHNNNSSCCQLRLSRQNVIRASLISSNLVGNYGTTASSPSIFVDSTLGKIDDESNSFRNRTKSTEEERGNKLQDILAISSSLEEDDHQEKLDEWMEYSVPEIVKNIEEAPLFMHVYGAKTAIPTTSIRIEKEKAVAESWPSITRRWEQGSPIPDGIILVEQLHHYDHDDSNSNEEVMPIPNSSSSRTTTAWGVLVQGRGDSVCACYILKTCRVRSSLGFCTHFCLARAKCFGEIAELQLKNSWLHHHTWQ